MVRVFFDCDNYVESVTDLYGVRADIIKCNDVDIKKLHNFADYISMCFGTHHSTEKINTYLEYVELRNYDDFLIALKDLDEGNCSKAFTRLSRFAIGIINIEED